ncbi:MAG TPA: hypothetical protein VKP13_00805 [Nitrospira sp.]|nr:hypothetical protein [Nitrospira sp.]
MTLTNAFETAILERVAAQAPVSLEDLQQLFRHDSWNRLFAAIGRLSRTGALAIRRVDRSTYLISPGPRLPVVEGIRPPGNTPSSAGVRT